MNKQILTDNQEKWLTALESGKYEQTTGMLNQTKEGKTCYCVLGIADHLFPPKRKTANNTYRYENIEAKLSLLEETPTFEHTRDIETNINNVIGFINKEFNRNIGLKEDLYYIPTIIYLNDVYNLTFKQIAKVMRFFPELYFKKAKTNGQANIN